jgi:cysteinyl-tRNA synthetase
LAKGLEICKTETLDIHAGGRDLVFPHHENEIAQSEALTGKPFAKYWIHHGLLTINGQKMSKSLGNFITVEDILKKHKPEDLKFFFLLSHYASPIDFTEEKIEDAHKALGKFRLLLKEISAQTASVVLGKGRTDVDELETEIFDAMDDDFNTAKAVSHLFELSNQLNKILAKDGKSEVDLQALKKGGNILNVLLGDIFGLLKGGDDESLSADAQKVLDERAAARQNKDFKRSDELRDKLKEMGIIVEDKKEGQRWRRA